MKGELLKKCPDCSEFVPVEGWALFERPPSAKLNQDARAYLVELFEAGRLNRNHRVSSTKAGITLRDKFPAMEET